MNWPYILLIVGGTELVLAVVIGRCLHRAGCPETPAAAVLDDAERAVRERVRRVVADRSLVIVFQPIVDSETRTPVGFEALSRLARFSPAEPPEQWFAAASRLGVGIEVELLAASMGLEAAAELPGDTYLSLNLSPAAILTGRADALFRHSGWPAHRTVLEITEHESITDYSAFRRRLAPLRRLGVRIAVDDAGAGYASFRHILCIGPDHIKLDRSLISEIDADPARRALVTAMIRFGREIGATVIAEGIETERELLTVRQLGVTTVQGYLLGEPDVVGAWCRRGDIGREARLRPGVR